MGWVISMIFPYVYYKHDRCIYYHQYQLFSQLIPVFKITIWPMADADTVFLLLSFIRFLSLIIPPFVPAKQRKIFKSFSPSLVFDRTNV